MYVCKECGSSKISMLAWVNPNEGATSDIELADNDGWCSDCSEESTIIFKSMEEKDVLCKE